MKRIIASIFVLAATAGLWGGYAQQPYFTTEEMPDLIKCLPAPPKKGSAAFRNDKERYKWGKRQRKDPARAEMARIDAAWSFDTLLMVFSEPFGMELSKEKTPEVWTLIARSLTTTDQIRFAPKAYYQRTRPFAYFKDEAFLAVDAPLKSEGSYPSGHTLRSWTCALILSEVNPAAAEAIFTRAWECGQSRVISGAHWQSDVDITRMAAGIGYARLQTSGEFRKQMELAKKEIERIRKI